MFACVVCGSRVRQLYKQYSALSIRLERCQSCGSVADKDSHLGQSGKAIAASASWKLWQVTICLLVLDAGLIHLGLTQTPLLEVCEDHSGAATYSVTSSFQTGAGHVSAASLSYLGSILVMCCWEHAMFLLGVFGVVVVYRQAKLRHPDGGTAGASGSTDSASAGGASLLKAITKAAVGAGQEDFLSTVHRAVLFPSFVKFLALFVMIWDEQIVILNTISLLVLTSQHLALSVVLAVFVAPNGEGSFAPQHSSRRRREGFLQQHPPRFKTNRRLALAAMCAGVCAKVVARGLFWALFGVAGVPPQRQDEFSFLFNGLYTGG